jgi:hypothetical protein
MHRMHSGVEDPPVKHSGVEDSPVKQKEPTAMTSDQSPSPPSPARDPDDRARGGAQQRAIWSLRQTVGALGVAAVIAGLGGAAIDAATSNGSGTFGGGLHSGPGPGGLGGAGQGGFQRVAPAGGTGTLHGEFVVSDGKGGYTTSMTQTGTLTAVSGTSITAKSADGYTMTYVVKHPGSRIPFAVNDEVTIQATLVNGTATETSLVNANPIGAPSRG